MRNTFPLPDIPTGGADEAYEMPPQMQPYRLLMVSCTCLVTASAGTEFVNLASLRIQRKVSENKTITIAEFPGGSVLRDAASDLVHQVTWACNVVNDSMPHDNVSGGVIVRTIPDDLVIWEQGLYVTLQGRFGDGANDAIRDVVFTYTAPKDPSRAPSDW